MQVDMDGFGLRPWAFFDRGYRPQSIYFLDRRPHLCQSSTTSNKLRDPHSVKEHMAQHSHLLKALSQAEHGHLQRWSDEADFQFYYMLSTQLGSPRVLQF